MAFLGSIKHRAYFPWCGQQHAGIDIQNVCRWGSWTRYQIHKRTVWSTRAQPCAILGCSKAKQQTSSIQANCEHIKYESQHESLTINMHRCQKNSVYSTHTQIIIVMFFLLCIIRSGQIRSFHLCRNIGYKGSSLIAKSHAVACI